MSSYCTFNYILHELSQFPSSHINVWDTIYIPKHKASNVIIELDFDFYFVSKTWIYSDTCKQNSRKRKYCNLVIEFKILLCNGLNIFNSTNTLELVSMRLVWCFAIRASLKIPSKLEALNRLVVPMVVAKQSYFDIIVCHQLYE